MIVGVEQTTDQQHPETKIKTFGSESAALKWAAERSGDFAWSGAATQAIPPHQQNWHRRFRYVYDLPGGFRRYQAEIKRLTAYRGFYAYDIPSAKAAIASRHGTEIRPPDTREASDG